MPNDRPKTVLHVRFACWGLLPEHVRRLRPEWSGQQALDFLVKRQARIAREMGRLGWIVLADELDRHERGDET